MRPFGAVSKNSSTMLTQSSRFLPGRSQACHANALTSTRAVSNKATEALAGYAPFAEWATKILKIDLLIPVALDMVFLLSSFVRFVRFHSFHSFHIFYRFSVAILHGGISGVPRSHHSRLAHAAGPRSVLGCQVTCAAPLLARGSLQSPLRKKPPGPAGGSRGRPPVAKLMLG